MAASSMSHRMSGVGRFLRREFNALWPIFLFFLVGFLLLITLIKLALAQFSIEVPVISNALVGALIAAKAALVLDETPLARALDHYRRIVGVVVKTAFYGIVSLILGYVERLLEAMHKVHSFNGAIQYVYAHASHYRLLAWALGISIVFALYFSFSEIARSMGAGRGLRDLFFETPALSGASDRR